jgi:hypothetical protein
MAKLLLRPIGGKCSGKMFPFTAPQAGNTKTPFKLFFYLIMVFYAPIMSLRTVIVAINSPTLRKYDTKLPESQVKGEMHEMEGMDMHMGHSM